MESNAHLAAPTSLEVPPGATADVGESDRPPMGSLIESKRALRKIVRSELRGMSAEQRAEEGTWSRSVADTVISKGIKGFSGGPLIDETNRKLRALETRSIHETRRCILIL